MSVIDTVQNLLSSDEETEPEDNVTEYECNNCGNTFESAVSPEKAKCMECLSSDTKVAE